MLELAEQQLICERFLDVLLNDAAERTGTELLVITLLADPLERTLGEFDGDAAVGKLGFELEDELLDDLG